MSPAQTASRAPGARMAVAFAAGPLSAEAMSVAPRLLTNLSYLAMMCLSIGLNLLPVFLTALSATYGGAAGLTQEQLGRLGASTFAGLVVGILAMGPLADRWAPRVISPTPYWSWACRPKLRRLCASTTTMPGCGKRATWNSRCVTLIS